MMDFHMTRRGATFYDYHVPEIMKALQDIHVELKRANDLKEQEMKEQEHKKGNGE